MKKSLIFVITIMLIMSLCVSFVACKDDKPEDPVNPVNPVTPEEKELTESDIISQNMIVSYTNAWLINNYNGNTFDSTSLSSVLNEIKDTGIIKSIRVSAADNSASSFKINIEFKDGAKNSIDVKLPEYEQGVYAGVEVMDSTKVSNADKIIGKVATAALKGCKNAIQEAQGAFAEDGDGFGFSGKAYFQFNYGDLTEDLVDAALAVRGNIAPDAKDTFLALEILIEDDVIAGLYYDGNEEQEDTRIYLYINYGSYNQKLYINNADINAIINGILGNDIAQAGDASDATPWYEMEFDSLTDILKSIPGADSVASIVSPIVSAVIGGYEEKVSGGVHYQLVIDLDDLLSSVIGALGTTLGNLDLSALPAPLNQLDLGSFQGIGGKLVIDSVVDNESKALSSLEISYNCAKKDFRFSKTDTVAKVYGPINFALGIEDFSIGAQDKDTALKINQKDALEGFKYFSPLNAEAQANFVVTETGTIFDGIYSMTFKSDINPFVLDQGQMELNVLKDNQQFINAYFDIEWDDVILTLTFGNDVYHGFLSDIAWAEKFAPFASYAVSEDSIIAPIVSYIQELKGIFGGSAEASDAEISEEIPPIFNFDINAITKAFDIKDAIENLIKEWEKVPAILDYKFSNLEQYFHLSLAKDEYNQVVTLVKDNLIDLFPILSRLPNFEDTAAVVTIDWNYKDNKDMAIVTVEYDNVTYVAVVDYSGWADTKEAIVSLTIKTSIVVDDKTQVVESIYAGKLDLSKWESDGICHITYDVMKGDVDVNYIDFTLTYKKGETSTIVLKLTGEDVHTYTFTGAIADGIGTYTANLDGVELKVYGGKGHFTRLDKNTSFGIPTFEVGCTFGFDFPKAQANVELSSLKLISYGEAVKITAPAEVTDAKDVGDLVDVLVNALTTLISK